MRVIDVNGPSQRRRLKALVYGKSGTGKTTFGVSAPRPLILLNELQALPHIRAAAQRMNRPMPAVLHMQRTQDYRDVLRALHGDRSKPFTVTEDDGGGPVVIFEMEQWPETVVIDSLTEVCELVSDEIRRESPPKTGKDGLPVDSERYWNVFQDRAAKLIRAYRDVDMNVLFLCLLDDRTIGEGDDAHRWVGPMMAMRRLPGVVQAAVNVVGVTARRLRKDEKTGELLPEYVISTMGPEYMETKPFPPLRKTEVTDFASWCKRINGEDDGAPEPAPITPEEIAAADQKVAELAEQENHDKRSRRIAESATRKAATP